MFDFCFCFVNRGLFIAGILRIKNPYKWYNITAHKGFPSEY